jgi:hypothetical protein
MRVGLSSIVLSDKFVHRDHPHCPIHAKCPQASFGAQRASTMLLPTDNGELRNLDWCRFPECRRCSMRRAMVPE